MPNLFWIVAIAFLVTACNSKQATPVDCITIDLPLKQTNHKIALSDLVDSLQYVPLETSDSSLIGAVDKLMVTDKGQILILDKYVANALFQFDQNGQFIRKIGRRGLGEGEYVEIEDFSYIDDKVMLWDVLSKRLLEYDFNGDFQCSYSFNFTAYSIHCINAHRVAFCSEYTSNHALLKNDEYPAIIYVDLLTGQIDGDLYFDSAISSEAYVTTLNNLSNGNFYLPLNDTIYQASVRGVERKYALRYKSSYLELKNEYIERTKDENIKASEADENYQHSLYPHLITYFTCDNLDIFYMRMQDYLYYGFYYPKERLYFESSATRSIPVINDMDSIAMFAPRFSQNNVLFCILDPSLVEDKSALIKKGIEILDEDNPIIVKLFMKSSYNE